MSDHQPEEEIKEAPRRKVRVRAPRASVEQAQAMIDESRQKKEKEEEPEEVKREQSPPKGRAKKQKKVEREEPLGEEKKEDKDGEKPEVESKGKARMEPQPLHPPTPLFEPPKKSKAGIIVHSHADAHQRALLDDLSHQIQELELRIETQAKIHRNMVQLVEEESYKAGLSHSLIAIGTLLLGAGSAALWL